LKKRKTKLSTRETISAAVAELSKNVSDIIAGLKSENEKERLNAYMHVYHNKTNWEVFFNSY